MLVKVDELEFSVKWQHITTDNDKPARATVCTISCEKLNRVVQSMAVCSPKDNFNKQTGRKVSMHRALSQMFPYQKNDPDMKYFVGREPEVVLYRMAFCVRAAKDAPLKP